MWPWLLLRGEADLLGAAELGLVDHPHEQAGLGHPVGLDDDRDLLVLANNTNFLVSASRDIRRGVDFDLTAFEVDDPVCGEIRLGVDRFLQAIP